MIFYCQLYTNDRQQYLEIIALPSSPNAVELRRHSGMDRRNLGYRDVRGPSHPWNLGSGDPCRNDGHKLRQQHGPLALSGEGTNV